MKRGISRITAVLNPAKSREVIHALQREGIARLSMDTGRSAVLEETSGFAALWAREGLRLASDPVEILSFCVEDQFEDDMMSLVAERARLAIPGMGTLFSQAVEVIDAHPLCQPNVGRVGQLPKPENLYSEVIGVSCTVVRGEADRIARTVLQSGACVPAITFGTGTGVRDKLGLLRITLPAEKEVITAVMSRYDANAVMELMIEAGRLDQIGRGIIYAFPVRQAIINTRISRGSARHAASMEQIISAVDSLKGGFEWRRGGGEVDGGARPWIEDRLNLAIECDEGRGPELVAAAMGSGAAGATSSRYKIVTPATAPGEREDRVSPAREICHMLVPPENVERLTQTLRRAGLLDSRTHGVITAHPVPKAFAGTS